jgi:transcriptional activator HAC1
MNEDFTNKSPVPDAEVVEASSAKDAPATSSASATTSTDMTQHPAVSVGGGAASVDGVATEVASGAGSLSSAQPTFDSLFGDALSTAPAFDLNSWSTEAQFSPSSDPLNFEYHHLDGDASAELPDLDFTQYLSDDVSGAGSGAMAGHVSSIHQELEPTFGLDDFENQISSEAFNQQPHTGASSFGCDDGVIAVGL